MPGQGNKPKRHFTMSLWLQTTHPRWRRRWRRVDKRVRGVEPRRCFLGYGIFFLFCFLTVILTPFLGTIQSILLAPWRTQHNNTMNLETLTRLKPQVMYFSFLFFFSFLYSTNYHLQVLYEKRRPRRPPSTITTTTTKTNDGDEEDEGLETQMCLEPRYFFCFKLYQWLIRLQYTTWTRVTTTTTNSTTTITIRDKQGGSRRDTSQAPVLY